MYQDKEFGNKWIGPAEVQGMEGKTVWVTVNGNLRKIASCNVRFRKGCVCYTTKRG